MTTDLPHQWSSASGYAQVNELTMYYEIHGTGVPLVLLHGAMGTIDSCFSNLLPALARTRKVIAVELQGHGHTPDIDRPLSYEQMAEDLAGLLHALEIDVADFVGYSMGGAAGFQLALRHPSMVRRLVIAGGTCFRPEGLYPEMQPGSGSPTPEDLAGSPWHQAYLEVAPDPAAWPTLVAKVGELDAGFAGWSADEVRSLAAPTLLMIGDSDIVRPEHTMEMFRLLGGGVAGDLVGLPDSQLAILPGTSHVGLLERDDWLQSMIGGFLDPTRETSHEHRRDKP
jgi:pimeloyl-ACP methyl ester carboxylesterase